VQLPATGRDNEPAFAQFPEASDHYLANGSKFGRECRLRHIERNDRIVGLDPGQQKRSEPGGRALERKPIQPIDQDTDSLRQAPKQHPCDSWFRHHRGLNRRLRDQKASSGLGGDNRRGGTTARKQWNLPERPAGAL
jgi:hypothetical protein